MEFSAKKTAQKCEQCDRSCAKRTFLPCGEVSTASAGPMLTATRTQNGVATLPSTTRAVPGTDRETKEA